MSEITRPSEVLDIALSNARAKLLTSFLEERHLFDRGKLRIRHNTWDSASNSDGGITIGVGEMSRPMKIKLLFEGESYSYEEEIQHRFVHEALHKFIPHIRLNWRMDQSKQEINDVYKKLEEIRTNDKTRGLSALASWSPYQVKGSTVQALEDFVELGVMYVLNPQRLDRFFQRVVESNDSRLRRENGIADISKDESRMIRTNIKNSFDRLLNL